MNKKEIKTIPLEYRHDIKFRDIPFERNIDGLKCYYNFSNENNQFVSEIFSDKSVKSRKVYYSDQTIKKNNEIDNRSETKEKKKELIVETLKYDTSRIKIRYNNIRNNIDDDNQVRDFCSKCNDCKLIPKYSIEELKDKKSIKKIYKNQLKTELKIHHHDGSRRVNGKLLSSQQLKLELISHYSNRHYLIENKKVLKINFDFITLVKIDFN